MPVTAVVTGASGHLGTNLVQALLDAGKTVRAVDVRRGAGLEAFDVEFVAADVLDPDDLGRAFAGADVVYHLAARISIAGDPDGLVWRVNVDGAAHAAFAAQRAGARRFVHCSSLHAFDTERAGRTLDESAARAVDPRLPVYDRSKWAGEQAVRQAAAQGLDAVILHPTAIIGPADPEPSRMGRMLRAACRGRMPAVVPGGFDWVDVRDVAAAFIAAGERGRAGESYLIGGRHATVAEITGIAAEVAGRRAPRFTVPTGAARLLAAASVGVVRGRRAGRLMLTPESLRALALDAEVVTVKARHELGHSPRPLTDTIGDLYRWFHDRGMLR